MGAPPPGGGQSGSGDNSLGPLWVMVGLFVGGWLIWTAWHAEIIMAYFKLKEWEIALVSFFASGLEPLSTYLKQVDPSGVTFTQAADVSTIIGEYLRYPIILIIGVFAFIVYFLNVNSRFRRTYSMQSLIEEEKTNWPQVMPIVKPDIHKASIHKGPWAMALTPLDFAMKHDLIEDKEQLIRDCLSGKKPLIKIDKGKARSIFAIQMGQPWQGIEKLPDHTLGLFTVFACCAVHDRKTANELISQFATSATAGKIDVTNVKKILSKIISDRAIGRVVHSHAYVYTVMTSMLELARTDGVLASADFIWLKLKERALWYVLNTVGRQTPFVETAGPYAHWLAERELRRKIHTPMVDEAVEALVVALAEVLYVPTDEDEEMIMKQEQA